MPTERGPRTGARMLARSPNPILGGVAHSARDRIFWARSHSEDAMSLWEGVSESNFLFSLYAKA